jgi:hypothetical protein
MTRALAVLLLLAGCAPQAPEPTLAGPPPDAERARYPQGFACPPAVSIVETSTVGVTRYFGSRDGDPEVCIVQQPGRQQRSELLYGMFIANAAESPQMREAFRAFFPLSVGRRAEHLLLGQGSQWRITMSVPSEERITVRAGTFDTWVVEILEEGYAGNAYAGSRRIWFDKTTWLPVRQDNTLIRGNVAEPPDWQAVRVRRAPG